MADDNAVTEPQPQLGIWQRFCRWFAGTPQPAVPGRYVPDAPDSMFTTPSKGDAYDFTVRIIWWWTGGRWRDRRLAETVEPLKAEVWEQITVAARCILRAFPPNQAAEAEEALNQRLTQIIRDGQVSTSIARWMARAEVTPHEAIREQQQKAWARRLEQAADHELAGIIAHDYAEIASKWRTLLQQVGIDTTRPNSIVDESPPPFIGRYLVRLAANPATAADVVDALSERREQKDRELLQTVADAVRGHDNLNLLETDIAYDSALRRLMDWAGLPLPELTERPLPDEEYR